MSEDVEEVKKELIDLLSESFSTELMAKLLPDLWHLNQRYHCILIIDGPNGKGVGADADNLDLKKIKKTKDYLTGVAEKIRELATSRANHVGIVNAPPTIRTFKTHVGAGAELKAATNALEAAVAIYNDYLTENSRISPVSARHEVRDDILRACKKAMNRELSPKRDRDLISKIYTLITDDYLSDSTIDTRISLINKE